MPEAKSVRADHCDLKAVRYPWGEFDPFLRQLQTTLYMQSENKKGMCETFITVQD